MNFSEISERAFELRQKYEALEIKNCGRAWSKQEVFQGFVGDIGSLAKLIMAKEGLRNDVVDADEKLVHQLSDCLWCVLVLAKEYNIDLEKTFMESMDNLEQRINSNLVAKENK